jgi:hypothetical protein
MKRGVSTDSLAMQMQDEEEITATGEATAGTGNVHHYRVGCREIWPSGAFSTSTPPRMYPWLKRRDTLRGGLNEHGYFTSVGDEIKTRCGSQQRNLFTKHNGEANAQRLGLMMDERGGRFGWESGIQLLHISRSVVFPRNRTGWVDQELCRTSIVTRS